MITSTPLRRGLIVAALHVAIVASLGAKLLVDRAVRPRVWARAAPVDPNLPIRGRYVRLRLEAVPGNGFDNQQPGVGVSVELEAREGTLVATAVPAAGRLTARLSERAGERVAVLDQAVAFFIPEHVEDPSRRPAGEELWVEVTIPRAGAPRPIRLGVKNGSQLEPLEVR
jgi:hypothetical protein